MSKFLQKYDLYFLVIVNPDGYDLSTNVIFSMYFSALVFKLKNKEKV